VLNFIREIRDLIRFFRNAPNTPVMFYAEHEGYFPNFEGVLAELLGPGTEPVAYVTSSPRDPIFNRKDARLETYYVKHLFFLLMLFLKCRVCVMTMPDLHLFHIQRSIYPVHYVYMFHSLVSTHMIYRKHAFDHYDSILCAGPHHVREIRAFEQRHNLKPKELAQGGYYRLERIYNRFREYRAGHPRAQRKQPLILIAPSWGPQNILEVCGEELTGILLDSGFDVIVRPHPETVRKTPALVNRLEKKFKDRSGFLLERSIATDDSIHASDLLISDCSGIAFEYGFGTERPVVFCNVPAKVRNPDFEELNIPPMELALREQIGRIADIRDLAAVPAMIREMTAHREEYIDKIRLLRESYVFDFGRSSRVAAEHIRGKAQQENMADTQAQPMLVTTEGIR